MKLFNDISPTQRDSTLRLPGDDILPDVPAIDSALRYLFLLVMYILGFFPIR